MSNNLVKDLLEQLGIERIVWIDDRFSMVEDETYERHLGGLFEEILDSAEGGTKVGEFIDGFLPTAPPVIQQKLVSEYLKLHTGKLRAVEEILEKVRSELGIGKKSDLSPKAFEGLIASLVADVKKYSLKDWRGVSDEDKKQYAKCLFLVDRQFTREGSGAYAGDEIVHEISGFANSDHFCIMFTYTADEQNEEITRKEVLDGLYKNIGVNRSAPLHTAFHVLAKSRIHEDDAVEASFAEALKHTFLRSLHGQLVDITKTAMTAGAEKTATELAQLSIYDIDRSVFLNSLNEGASEVDVIFRLLGLGQRRSIEDMLVADERNLMTTLDRLRKLQASVPSDRSPILTAGSPIKQWREEEILVRGHIINSTFSPLACGDIFVKETKPGQKAKRFALLCQPCDLMVRSDGSSKGKEGFFVEILELGAGEQNDLKFKRPYFYSLEFPGGALVFDFRSWGTISIEVLRLAVFQKDGRVRFSHTDELPDAMHLPGWKKLFSSAKNRFNAPARGENANEENARLNPTYLYLSLNDNIGGRIGKGGRSDVTYPYSRERRIRTPYAEAVLSSFLNYNARAAFDHDFAASGESLIPS